MPHIDIKYNPAVLDADQLEDVGDALIDAVAKWFGEQPEYVSLEILPQGPVTRNRKSIDVEVNSSPDADGRRTANARDCADDLAKTLSRYVEDRGLAPLEISAWVRVFAAGEYAYGRVS